MLNDVSDMEIENWLNRLAKQYVVSYTAKSGVCIKSLEYGV